MAQATDTEQASREDHYSAKMLHFAAVHWPELESRKEDIRREYALLGEGEICLCGTKWAIGGDSARGGPRNTGDMDISSMRLDFERAYQALPMPWEGRTKVYLMIRLGYTEQQVANMLRTGEFLARHRRRIALESFGQPARPQDAIRETESAWVYMARFLHPVCRCGDRAA